MVRQRLIFFDTFSAVSRINNSFTLVKAVGLLINPGMALAQENGRAAVVQRQGHWAQTLTRSVRRAGGNVLRSRPWRRLCIDLGDRRRTVLLAGSGRSGTTWVEDIINYRGTFRVMFEPFHSRKVPILSHWNYRQYLRPGTDSARFREPATWILSGQIRNAWVDQFNTTFIARQRIVKDIRANLFLRWIRGEYPEIPIVLLLRHPCAMATSKLRMQWDTHLGDFLSQRELVDDHLLPFVPYIRDATDVFDKHIFMWCIENYVPLRQFSPGEIHVTFYENFCTDPESEARALLEFLGQPFGPELRKTISKPSAMSRSWSAVATGGSMTDAWRKEINPRQVDRAVEILRLFGLDRIYDASSLPLVTGDEALRLFGTHDEALQTVHPQVSSNV